MIQPPQQNIPEVKAVGKTISLVFQEDLQDSTTYTINFGSAICDYNEKTPL
ncbi:MAG: Ig-like domain-containing protein, partial [Oscillospiraceae bacterium]|nr:Ig-like domain-containing protein [Oscillospiraceae bacterium]